MRGTDRVSMRVKAWLRTRSFDSAATIDQVGAASEQTGIGTTKVLLQEEMRLVVKEISSGTGGSGGSA
jgi:hypothetical protein